jgi:peptide/nickel transport system substrate-binding protein
LGIALLAALLRYAAYNFTTVLVPDRGGTLVEGIAGNPRYLNPLLSQNNLVDETLVSLLFAGLTQLDERGNVVPDLAETWRISADGLTYDFLLRPDLRWQDGLPVIAADVLYTMGAMQADDFPGLADLGLFWRTVKVTAPDGPDGLTVRFVLQQPLASFLDYTTIGLLPAHLWGTIPVGQVGAAQLNTRPIGAGPFQLHQITATRAELVANPRYHGSAPYLTGLTFRFYPDQQSLWPAYDRGEIDAIAAIDPADAEQAAKRTDLNLLSAPLAGYTLIYLNLQNQNLPFFKETAVRQALVHALDRQALIDKKLAGRGVVIHSPILSSSWAYDPETREYPYDVSRAQQLLDAAGWRDSDGDGVRDREGVKLAFILVGSDAALVDAIATAWGRIGVQAAAQPISAAGLASDFLAPRAFDAAVAHWELPGDPDPYPLWHSTQIQSGQNYGGWNQRAADEALERARARLSPAERRADYVQFQRLFTAETPALLLFQPVYLYGVRTKVRDVQIGPLNRPADRFRSLSNWYIVTRRMTVGGKP